MSDNNAPKKKQVPGFMYFYCVELRMGSVQFKHDGVFSVALRVNSNKGFQIMRLQAINHALHTLLQEGRVRSTDIITASNLIAFQFLDECMMEIEDEADGKIEVVN